MRVLIIGGYGFFGGRLSRLLAGEGLDVIIGGRDLAAAQALAATLPGASAAAIDRDAPLEGVIGALSPDVVVDASGPFQAYGADPYRVARAALTCGAHYLDLADDGAFIEGIAELDSAVRDAGRVALSGLSTVPALSGAALRRLAQDLGHVEAAAVGIAPSPFAGLGRNVLRAIAQYAGKPAPSAHAGARPLGVALVDRRVVTVAPPGALPLRARTFSLVQSLPSHRPDLADVWVGAGTAPEVLHRGLNFSPD